MSVQTIGVLAVDVSIDVSMAEMLSEIFD